jgi:hypothetical protein
LFIKLTPVKKYEDTLSANVNKVNPAWNRVYFLKKDKYPSNQINYSITIPVATERNKKVAPAIKQRQQLKGSYFRV